MVVVYACSQEKNVNIETINDFPFTVNMPYSEIETPPILCLYENVFLFKKYIKKGYLTVSLSSLSEI
jgi:hypothetical protein